MTTECLSRLLMQTKLQHWLIRYAPSFSSTNSVLLQEAKTGSHWSTPVVLITDYQTAGRGRHGKTWISDLGSSLLCSVGMTLPLSCNQLIGLPLAASLALILALEDFILNHHNVHQDTKTKNQYTLQLKWPNDILLSGRKIAGVLVEVAKCNKARVLDKQNDACASFEYTNVVIGFGINLTASHFLFDKTSNPRVNGSASIENKQLFSLEAASLDECLPGVLVFKYELLRNILLSLNDIVDQFVKTGFASLKQTWWQKHIYQNEEIRVYENNNQILSGKVIGVDDIGCLLLQVGDFMKVIMSGDIDGDKMYSIRY